MKGELACEYCSSTAFEENGQGDAVCQDCGRIVPKANFAEDLQYNQNQEVQGQRVNLNKSTYNKFLHLNERDTIQKRIDSARTMLDDLHKRLNVRSEYDDAIDQTMRIIKIATDRDFFGKGRNLDNYAAAAYYISLRMKTAPYLLIDISDKLGVNLFRLARCFLRLVRFIGMQEKLPLIEPVIFIKRYCGILDFGEKTSIISKTATYLVRRMKRDWMAHGRRPSSLCGAAILIAAKLHEVPCTTRDICEVVSVCDETIKRRLDEFKQTKTAKLTREQFQQLEDRLDHLEGEQDPPAFSKARMKSMKVKQQVSESDREIQEFVAMEKEEKDEESQDEQLSLKLNISNEVLDQEADEIEHELQKVESSVEARLPELGDKKDNSYYTDGEHSDYGVNKRPRDYVLNEKETLSDISDGEVETFLLSEDEQRIKKLMWIKMNKTWLDKQTYREENANRIIKKRQKRVKDEPGKAADAYEAITNSKLGEKNINKIELKRMLADRPDKSMAAPTENFNAFAYQPSQYMPESRM